MLHSLDVPFRKSDIKVFFKGKRISILGGYYFVYFQKRKGSAVWAFFQCQVLISFRLLIWCCWQAVPKATKKLGFIHLNCARLGFMCWDEKSVELRSSRESITSSLTAIIDPDHSADFSSTDGDIIDDVLYRPLREEFHFKSRSANKTVCEAWISMFWKFYLFSIIGLWMEGNGTHWHFLRLQARSFTTNSGNPIVIKKNSGNPIGNYSGV